MGDDGHRGAQFGAGGSAGSVRHRPQAAPLRGRRDGKRRTDGRDARPRTRRSAPDPPEKPWAPSALPSTANLVSRTAINGALYPLRASRVMIPSALKAIGQLARLPGKLAGGIASTLGRRFRLDLRSDHSVQRLGLPASSFRGPLPRPRGLQADQGSVPKATINDVAVAYVGGAFVDTSKGTVSCRTRHSWRHVPRRSETPARRAVAATGCSAERSRWKRIRRTRTSASNRSPPSPPCTATTPILRVARG